MRRGSTGFIDPAAFLSSTTTGGKLKSVARDASPVRHNCGVGVVEDSAAARRKIKIKWTDDRVLASTPPKL